MEVATEKILSPHIGPTRTEQEFARHVQNVVAADPKASWALITDQLNTHQSESLVQLFARLENIRADLGKKGQRGILLFPSRGTSPKVVLGPRNGFLRGLKPGGGIFMKPRGFHG